MQRQLAWSDPLDSGYQKDIIYSHERKVIQQEKYDKNQKEIKPKSKMDTIYIEYSKNIH